MALLCSAASLAPLRAPAEPPPPTPPAAATQAAPADSRKQPVRTYPLNTYKRELDGQWQGIRLASDGNVYFASSSHSAHHGASFFKYDTKAKRVTELVHDLTEVCGEKAETNPQGKVHSDIVEADGWLYMSTHFAAEKPGAYASWTGSHALGYEIATGKWRDYGVIRPGFTSYSAVGVDPARKYLYVFVTGQAAGQAAYVYRIHTVSGEKVNLGQVSSPSDGGYDYTSAWMFVDRRGDVWFAIKNQGGDLRQIHGDTGVIEVHANALPPLVRWDEDRVEKDAEIQKSRSIAWMQPLDGDRAVLTMNPTGGMLYSFDSTRPMATAFKPLRHIGFSYLGMAVGGGRVFYYQRANRGKGNQDFRDFHLLSVSLDAASGYPITDHGLMVDQDGRTVWRAPGMQTDGNGQLYMVGDWWTIPGDLGTLRYKWRAGKDTWEPLDRGQFFGVATIAASATN